MIFLIVPGVIISLGWSIIGPVYLHEDIGLFSTFGRSWQLTNGYKGWVWLAQIVMSFITTIIFIVPFSILSAVVLGPMMEPDFIPEQNLMTFLYGMFFSLSIYIALSLYASLTCAIYTELREIREGLLNEEVSDVFA